MHLAILTTVTMIAFAANSVFARLALAEDTMDPASYSMVRLGSGALVLALLVFRTGIVDAIRNHGNWPSAAALFVYAAGFSFAYLALDTGMGALILFACVQATMIGWSVVSGDRPSRWESLGLAVAFAAFIGLVSPGVTAPDPVGTGLMVAAGIAWGIYSLRGFESREVGPRDEFGDFIGGDTEAYFNFEYIGIDLAAPSKVFYKHRLSGIDKDWVQTNRRFVQYTNLNSGTYTFMVKAQNQWGRRARRRRRF